MKANAEPVRLPPVAIDAELSLSFAVRLRRGLCTRFRPNYLHSVALAQQSHRPAPLGFGGAGATLVEPTALSALATPVAIPTHSATWCWPTSCRW
jgi:hypothetical protein